MSANHLRDAALRSAEILGIAARMIRENCPEARKHYDEAVCDGYCVADDCESAAQDLLFYIARSEEAMT